MIKFFRQFRQNMIKDPSESTHSREAGNRISKYLLYAIGEIVLVVIGILIALQINNWNEDRKEQKEEQLLLQNLKDEFTRNLEELRSDHAINLENLKAGHFFLEHDMLTTSTSQVDSLVGELCTYATFDPSIGYFEQAIHSNKLDLLKSDSLKLILSQWSGELSDLREDNMIRRGHWLNHLLPAVREHIPIRNSDQSQFRADYIRTLKITPKEVSQENYLRFVTSLEVDGIIYDHYMNQSYVVINEENIEQYILRVLRLIDEELNKES